MRLSAAVGGAKGLGVARAGRRALLLAAGAAAAAGGWRASSPWRRRWRRLAAWRWWWWGWALVNKAGCLALAGRALAVREGRSALRCCRGGGGRVKRSGKANGLGNARVGARRAGGNKVRAGGWRRQRRQLLPRRLGGEWHGIRALAGGQGDSECARGNGGRWRGAGNVGVVVGALLAGWLAGRQAAGWAGEWAIDKGGSKAASGRGRARAGGRAGGGQGRRCCALRAARWRGMLLALLAGCARR